MTISTRALGRKRRLLEDWFVPVPPGLGGGEGGPVTLRELIMHIVAETVRRFRRRQADNRFVRALTDRQIDQQARRGRIDPGGRDLKQDVDEGAAIATALQAFEDGLYLVIIDGAEHRDLDAQVFLRPDSQITFLRLVMLAGG